MTDKGNSINIDGHECYGFIENMDGDEMYIVPVLLNLKRTCVSKNEGYRETVYLYMGAGDEIRLPSVKNTNMWESSLS